jgi:hypothetical protein
MGRYFSAERVQQLLASQEQVHRQFRELRDKMFLRTYKTSAAGSTRSTVVAAPPFRWLLTKR